MSVSAAELVMLVPAATAAGSMLVVLSLNGLATIERKVSGATLPASSPAPRVPPRRPGPTEAPPAAPDEAANRADALPTSSPRGLRHTRVHRYGYRPGGHPPRPPIKLACGAGPDPATSTVSSGPAEGSP
ncbi:MAG TPA: hypothetical protein VGK51_00110 [Actinomycetota bacterium]